MHWAVAQDHIGGNAEIENYDAAFRSHTHVGGFEVPVQLSRAMDGGQPLGKLNQRRPETCCIQFSGAHEFQKPAAVDQFHGEEPVVAFTDELIQGHQIRVSDVGESAEFFLQTIDRVGIRPSERLERDHLVANMIAGGVNHAHAAGAQSPEDLKPLGSAKLVASERHHPSIRARCVASAHRSVDARRNAPTCGSMCERSIQRTCEEGFVTGGPTVERC